MFPDPDICPEPDMCPAVIFPKEISRREVGLSKSASARLLVRLLPLALSLELLLLLPRMSLSLRPKALPPVLSLFKLSTEVMELKLSRTSRLSSLIAISLLS